MAIFAIGSQWLETGKAELIPGILRMASTTSRPTVCAFQFESGIAVVIEMPGLPTGIGMARFAIGGAVPI